MDTQKLKKHIESYKQYTQAEATKYAEESTQRLERRHYYQSWNKDRILAMTPEEFEEYMSKLWAMLIWGNKKYVTDKIKESLL